MIDLALIEQRKLQAISLREAGHKAIEAAALLEMWCELYPEHTFTAYPTLTVVVSWLDKIYNQSQYLIAGAKRVMDEIHHTLDK